MRYFPLPFGLLLLWAVAGTGADDQPGKTAPSLKEGLAKLQGRWKLVKPPRTGPVYLGFDQGGLEVAHAVEYGEGLVAVNGEAVSKFELKEDGKRRSIAPVETSSDWSAIVYRPPGHTLVIEDGQCSVFDKLTHRGDYYPLSLKGEWLRLPGALDKLQGAWKPVKPPKTGEIDLEFAWEMLSIGGFSPGPDGKLDVSRQTVLVELKEHDKKRFVAPVKKNKAVSAITYRFDEDTLVIEEGEWGLHGKVSLKGEWKRFQRDRTRVP